MNLIVAILFLCVGASWGQTLENMTNLINHLFVTNKYNNIIRPINQQSDSLYMYINFYLITVNELDDVAEKMITTGYLDVEWVDDSLQWTPSDYGGINTIYVPQDKIWLPDLSLRNGFTAVEGMGDKIILVDIDNVGNVFWTPNGVFETKCEVDIRYFPFDKQSCDIEFGNWASTKDLIDVELGKKGILMEKFHSNGQWEVLSTSGVALEMSDTAMVRFTITMKRKPLYYIVNLVMPIMFLSILVAFTFVLPMESGEKMGYCITVFLAFAVFLTIISTLLPSGSQTTPFISIYLMILLITGTVIIMLTTLELRLHFRETEVPKFYKTLTKIGRRLRCVASRSKKSRVMPLFDKNENTNENNDYGHKDESDYGHKDESDSDDDITWHDVTANLDFLFFWFFLIFIVVLTGSILSVTYVQSM